MLRHLVAIEFGLEFNTLEFILFLEHDFGCRFLQIGSIVPRV